MMAVVVASGLSTSRIFSADGGDRRARRRPELAVPVSSIARRQQESRDQGGQRAPDPWRQVRDLHRLRRVLPASPVANAGTVTADADTNQRSGGARQADETERMQRLRRWHKKVVTWRDKVGR